jgi:hypothetical protein
MNLARLVEYLLVVLVAILVAVLVIWWLFPRPPECTECTVSRPTLRAECDKQFGGYGVRAKQLDAGAEDEFLVAYYDQAVVDPNASTGGYSPPGYSGATTTSTTPAVRGPGYVMVRALPQFGYDTSGGQTSGDLSATRPETSWQDVTVTVTRYVSPFRNDTTCAQNAVRFRDGRFETYCEIPNRFSDADGGQASYRIFVRNESSVPIEYCIISNCDASAPYGQGSLCVAEQPQQP